MALDKLVDSTQLDADLTSVANAIRTKGGTSGSLAFPAGFVSAVEAIETGGGGDNFASYINGSFRKYYSEDVTTITNSTLRNTILTHIAFPKIRSIGSAYALGQSGALEAADFGDLLSTIPTTAFANSSAFNVLVLRKTSVVSLSNINAFASGPFASGKAGGTLYVPSALISSYQSATNWSTILGYANNSIQAIEGSIYETQYADGTPIS